MSYEGPPTVFRFDKIANDIGCSVPGSVAGIGDMAFFLHKSGFYMVQGAQQLKPIGYGNCWRAANARRRGTPNGWFVRTTS